MSVRPRRVLTVDLAALSAGEAPVAWSWDAEGARSDSAARPANRPATRPVGVAATCPAGVAATCIGAWGGSALALALLARRPETQDDEPYLVLSVGEAVARGLPTAERTTVTARAPLTGLLAEGHVGSSGEPCSSGTGLSSRASIAWSSSDKGPGGG